MKPSQIGAVDTPSGIDQFCSDTDDECGPSARRGMLDIFRQRHRFTIGMHNQPSDKTFAKINKLHAKRLFTWP